MRLTIALREMKFHAYHGVAPQEAKVGNNFTVDISYSFPTENTCLSDELRDTVSYADVYNTVKAEMSHPSGLLEHVAGRVIGALKAGFPQLSYVRLTIAKLNPPLGGEVHSASVTMEETW
jgi:dihydroneopterin aldolase